MFAIYGPFKIKFEIRKSGGRHLAFDNFWAEDGAAHDLAGKAGCYVFGIRNRALTPVYVGMTKKSFQAETFNGSNCNKYSDGFSRYTIGTPLMFFVVHPDQKGRMNAAQIGEIEKFLIAAGAAKNPGLQNVKGKREPKWVMTGVVRGRAGPRSCAAIAFARMFVLSGNIEVAPFGGV